MIEDITNAIFESTITIYIVIAVIIAAYIAKLWQDIAFMEKRIRGSLDLFGFWRVTDEEIDKQTNDLIRVHEVKNQKVFYIFVNNSQPRTVKTINAIEFLQNFERDSRDQQLLEREYQQMIREERKKRKENAKNKEVEYTYGNDGKVKEGKIKKKHKDVDK